MRFSDVGTAVWTGVKSSLTPLSILLLAWGLKASCDRLMTGDFLAAMLRDVVSPLWFPILVFVCASVCSFATGTSWGTMAILIPTAIPVAFALDRDVYGLTTVICLGAVLDGAIFGDHCSPLSDTTILSFYRQQLRADTPCPNATALRAHRCRYRLRVWLFTGGVERFFRYQHCSWHGGYCATVLWVVAASFVLTNR